MSKNKTIFMLNNTSYCFLNTAAGSSA